MKKTESRGLRTNPEPALRKQAEKAVSDVYAQFSSGEERVQAVLYKVGDFIRAGVLDQSVIAQAEATANIESQHEWATAVLGLLEPIIRLQVEQPQEYERILRENTIRIAVERNGSIQLNEIIYYDRDPEGWMHLHIAPSAFVEGKLQLMKSALQQLAAAAQEDETCKGVVATSWIVGAHSRIAERFGFTVEGDISDEERKRGFSHEDADTPIKRATISREELIRRYLV